MEARIETFKEELDEHLDAINQNTTEIQAVFDYTAEVDAKVTKLSEKMDRILQLLENQKPRESSIQQLNLREQEVFLALYAENVFLSYADIARRISLPESMIPGIVDSIIAKGVPVLRKYQGPQVFVQIDEDFRNRQAKENLLHINEFVMTSVVTEIESR
mgnify:CR=1 FL=1